MGEKGAVATHIKAAIEYLEAARKLMEADEHFAAVLCAATGVERAAMGLVLHLGARPATRHSAPANNTMVPIRFMVHLLVQVRSGTCRFLYSSIV